MNESKSSENTADFSVVRTESTGPLLNEIVDSALAEGFTLVGCGRLRRLQEREQFFRQWLAAGKHADMHYLAREPDRRLDPRLLDPRLRSVIVLAYPYLPPPALTVDWRAEMRGRIAAYALGEDYHRPIARRAWNVASRLARAHPSAVFRVYVDTGPVLEREWAREAGLGWIGKNTLLLNREAGSYFFLAEILTSLELDPAPFPTFDGCGVCRRCHARCPTGALGPGYTMDARLCISYLTIENRGPIPLALRDKMGPWIFGCDVCQEVCPWNSSGEGGGIRREDLWPSLPELLALSQQEFAQRFRGSAVKRAKRRGLLRNVAVVMGNTGNPAAVPPLVRCLEGEAEPLIRAHAAWALGKIGGRHALAALERARRLDPDCEVRAEAERALEAAKG